MLLVSGTKRSGTSMWMQVLRAAGVPVLGEAFPRGWERTIKDANPEGFFESLFREGIYWRTNPHPETGRYVFAAEVRGYGCKVFVPGLIRTELAFIERIIANVREPREYEASLARLSAMEAEKIGEANDGLPPLVTMPPLYEWWMENFALVRDLSIRQYAFVLQSYAQVLAEPGPYVARALDGVEGADVDAATAAIRPEHRTQAAVETESEDPELATICDELYAAVEAGDGFSPGLLKTLNATNLKLLPRLMEIQQAVAQSRMMRTAQRHRAGATKASSGIPGLPGGNPDPVA